MQPMEFEWERDRELEEDDLFLKELWDKLTAVERLPAMLNVPRLMMMQQVFRKMEALAKDTGAAVSYSLHSVLRDMGSISIEGPCLDLPAKALLPLIRAANNTDMYPLTNGNVRLTLTFYGLTIPLIKEEK